MAAAVGHHSKFITLFYGPVIRFRPHRINYHAKWIFSQCFISIVFFQSKKPQKTTLLQPWNWILGGGYMWILGTWVIGALNTIFLVIKYVVLYSNENRRFHLNFVVNSQYMLHISFAHQGYFFHETPPQWPFPDENVIWLRVVSRPKFIVFLDSQIWSGTYFCHWHSINCWILHLIKIRSTDFFAIFPYMLKTGKWWETCFPWLILGPYSPFIIKITVTFEIICYLFA